MKITINDKDFEGDIFSGGLRVGLRANNSPFDKIIISNENIVIYDSVSNQLYEFSRNDITDIIFKKYLFGLSQGLKIEHTINAYNRKIVFGHLWFKFSKIKNSLVEHGWKLTVSRIR